jgi:hypothetical protein
MSLEDIMDYKTKLGRDKEQDVVSLITQYQKSNIDNKKSLIKKMIQIIGVNNTKQFLWLINKN